MLAGKVLLAVALVVSASVLSAAHSWVLLAPPPRLPRYIAACIGATIVIAGAVLLAFWITDPRARMPRDARIAIWILAAFTTTVGIGAVSYWTRGRAAPELFGDAFLGLLPPYLAVMLVLGAIDILVLYAVSLGQVH